MSYDRHVVELAQPFPEKYVHSNPSGGGSYIKHHVINQRLIQVFGRPPSFKVVEVIRGDVAEIPANPSAKSKRGKEGSPALINVVVAVIARLEVGFGDEWIVVEEAGDCEEPHNWKTDGQRLKDAMSDAYKRCAMRLGCGLHLWSQNEYFLYDELLKAQPRKEVDSPDAGAGSPTPQTSPPPASESSQGSSERGDSAPEPSSPKLAESVPTTPATSAEGPEDSQGASGPSPWEAISNAKESGLRNPQAIIRVASQVALKHSITIPTEGIEWDSLKDWPADALAEVVQRLGLAQGSLT